VTRVWWMMERLQNDADRRDFISTGAAVGFAAAFGAPVGGVLFALEEAASSWDSKLMWRTLTATTSACFVLAISERYVAPSIVGTRLECGVSVNDTARELFQPGLLTFQAAATFGYPWENFACIVIGMAGGLLGALFNRSHAAISRFRQRRLRRPSVQVLEVVCLSLVTSLVMFGLSLYGSCRDVNVRGESGIVCNTSEEPFRLQWATADGVPGCDSTEYNDMATALLVGQRRVIISMMEDPQRYSVLTQLAGGCTFFVLMTLTYGSAVPAGVFVPTIAAGACFGSLFGVGMEKLFREYLLDVLGTGDLVSAAPYTLQGAVALLGGVQRSSLSLVVIILEGTGAVQQLLPIILTTVVAKWSGDLLHKV
jgi:H+/Cl- antiporter ClcA